MAKMRGIKPEFWSDDALLDVQPVSRLLFIGLWNFACDNGHLDDKPRQIKARVFPADNLDVDSMLDELRDAGLITRGDGVVKVIKLAHHQRIDQRFLVTCAHCDGDEKARYSGRDKKPRSPGAQSQNAERSSSSRRVPAEHTQSTRRALVDEGEGEGEGEVPLGQPAVADGPADLSLVAMNASEPDRFEEFWEVYDRKRGKQAAHQKWKRAISRPYVTPALVIDGAAKYIQQQKALGKHPQYTMGAERWLHGEHWNDELDEDTPASNPYAHLKSPQQLAAERAARAN